MFSTNQFQVSGGGGWSLGWVVGVQTNFSDRLLPGQAPSRSIFHPQNFPVTPPLKVDSFNLGFGPPLLVGTLSDRKNFILHHKLIRSFKKVTAILI